MLGEPSEIIMFAGLWQLNPILRFWTGELFLGICYYLRGLGM